MPDPNLYAWDEVYELRSTTACYSRPLLSHGCLRMSMWIPLDEQRVSADLNQRNSPGSSGRFRLVMFREGQRDSEVGPTVHLGGVAEQVSVALVHTSGAPMH
jgi:hypothetical protein